jgi:hypothetical protein
MNKFEIKNSITAKPTYDTRTHIKPSYEPGGAKTRYGKHSHRMRNYRHSDSSEAERRDDRCPDGGMETTVYPTLYDQSRVSRSQDTTSRNTQIISVTVKLI